MFLLFRKASALFHIFQRCCDCSYNIVMLQNIFQVFFWHSYWLDGSTSLCSPVPGSVGPTLPAPIAEHTSLLAQIFLCYRVLINGWVFIKSLYSSKCESGFVVQKMERLFVDKRSHMRYWKNKKIAGTQQKYWFHNDAARNTKTYMLTTMWSYQTGQKSRKSRKWCVSKFSMKNVSYVAYGCVQLTSFCL